MAPAAMKKATKPMKSMKAKSQALTKGAPAEALANATELKKSDMLAVLGSLVSVAKKEVNKHGQACYPGVCMVKTRVNPATKAGKRDMFGNVVVVKTKPAKIVVKASAVAALKKAV